MTRRQAFEAAPFAAAIVVASVLALLRIAVGCSTPPSPEAPAKAGCFESARPAEAGAIECAPGARVAFIGDHAVCLCPQGSHP